ncbi:MAG TPA: GGDEF domain-containing protein, partial [Allocoleopsis sp.]
GDSLIVDAAQILKQTFRDADIVARLGGDEFVILVPACDHNSEDLFLRLQSSIAHFHQTTDRTYQLSMSIGINICVANETTSLEELVEQADKLMYEHKRTKCLAPINGSHENSSARE